MPYFRRLNEGRFLATEHVGGAWNTAEQHIAPALGLLAHAIEADHGARRAERLRIARLSYDILGTLPIGEVELQVSVLRPGRTIELVEAQLAHAGRAAVIARCWLLQCADTAPIAGTALPAIPPPEGMAAWNVGSDWPGGFVQSVEVRRSLHSSGRASSWVRPLIPLLDGEAVSPTASALGLIDIANGLAARVPPTQLAFPNVDLTVHLFAEPQGDWLGFDTAVSFGSAGVGLTHSVIHDLGGPIGTVVQCLTLRPL